ncbi:MAG TPA: 5-formyltetrahydrofolate cyclo-ligase [Thermoleophilia bacterium]
MADRRGDARPPAGPSGDKVELRRRALAARDALPGAARARLSVAVCARAASLPELEAAATIMLFAAFRSEVDTQTLLSWALEHGKAVCFPRILGPRRMAAYRVTDAPIHLVPGAWGIPEPREGLEEVPPERMDAVVVPGAAFDAAGRRCGYGGGFYDTYLPRTRPGIPWVALAFEAQLVDELPCEPHDLAVGTVVTEARIIRTR